VNPARAEFEKLDILPEKPAFSLVQLRHFKATQPSWPAADYMTAKSLAALYRWVEAREVLRGVIREFPLLPQMSNPALEARAWAWAELARQYCLQGKFRQAKAWLVKAIEIKSTYCHFRIQLVEIDARQGQWAEAEAQLTQAQRLCPVDADDQENIYYWRGWISRGQERWEEALSHFRRCPGTLSALFSADDLESALRGDLEDEGPVCELLGGRAQVRGFVPSAVQPG
jgi:tetratricopeptide (TPR) repeat protein